jgi:hypothetical protein
VLQDRSKIDTPVEIREQRKFEDRARAVRKLEGQPSPIAFQDEEVSPPVVNHLNQNPKNQNQMGAFQSHVSTIRFVLTRDSMLTFPLSRGNLM